MLISLYIDLILTIGITRDPDKKNSQQAAKIKNKQRIERKITVVSNKNVLNSIKSLRSCPFTFSNFVPFFFFTYLYEFFYFFKIKEKYNKKNE